MKVLVSDIENSDRKSLQVDFSEIYEEFNSDMPVKADLFFQVMGELIKITGNIKANIKLTCDSCLEEFYKDFDINVEEFFTKNNLNEDYSSEYEIKNDGFIEDLNGSDEIDVTDFVYQSLILAIPNKIVCGINCKGSDNLNKYIKSEVTDPRLEVFKNIKIEKDN